MAYYQRRNHHTNMALVYSAIVVGGGMIAAPLVAEVPDLVLPAGAVLVLVALIAGFRVSHRTRRTFGQTIGGGLRTLLSLIFPFSP